MTIIACPLCGAAHERLVVASISLVRCLACGLFYRNPPPVEHLRRHYDVVYGDIGASEHIDRHRRTIYSAFLDAPPPAGRTRLLDIGCGSGEFLALARECGYQVEGVEVSPRGVELARRRGLTVHAGVEALGDATYDVVTLWNVVDFFPRPLEQMREIHRVLAPGGVAVVRAPNAVYQLAAWRLSRLLVWPPALARLAGDAYFFQPLVWSPRTLGRLLHAAGFSDVHLWNSEVSSGDPYRAGSAARERLVSLVKHSLRAMAQAVYVASRRRLVVGSSFIGLARKAA